MGGKTEGEKEDGKGEEEDTKYNAAASTHSFPATHIDDGNVWIAFVCAFGYMYLSSSRVISVIWKREQR